MVNDQVMRPCEGTELLYPVHTETITISARGVQTLMQGRERNPWLLGRIKRLKRANVALTQALLAAQKRITELGG